MVSNVNYSAGAGSASRAVVLNARNGECVTSFWVFLLISQGRDSRAEKTFPKRGARRGWLGGRP